MLNIGDKAPDFELPDQQGSPTTLDALLAGGPLILYFYPADFSPVCTAEACAFRDRFDDVSKAGVQIVGISTQSPRSHERFSRVFSLPFPLLSDPERRAVAAYGVSGPFGFGVRRVTFLIDEAKIIRSRVVSDLFVGSHTDTRGNTAYCPHAPSSMGSGHRTSTGWEVMGTPGMMKEGDKVASRRGNPAILLYPPKRCSDKRSLATAIGEVIRTATSSHRRFSVGPRLPLGVVVVEKRWISDGWQCSCSIQSCPMEVRDLPRPAKVPRTRHA